MPVAVPHLCGRAARNQCTHSIRLAAVRDPAFLLDPASTWDCLPAGIARARSSDVLPTRYALAGLPRWFGIVLGFFTLSPPFAYVCGSRLYSSWHLRSFQLFGNGILVCRRAVEMRCCRNALVCTASNIVIAKSSKEPDRAQIPYRGSAAFSILIFASLALRQGFATLPPLTGDGTWQLR